MSEFACRFWHEAGSLSVPWPLRAAFDFEVRSFEKGLADRGGWREEILPMPEIEASFLHPFSYAPSGEEEHTCLENLLAVFFFGGVC